MEYLIATVLNVPDFNLKMRNMGIAAWVHLKVGIFHSFKGGTGKTTLALNVAKYLADSGYRVLLVETDVEMPCFLSLLPQKSVKSQPSRYFWNDVLDPYSGIGLKRAITEISSNFSAVYANNPVDASGRFTYPLFADQNFYRQSLLKIQREIAQLDRDGEYDFIIMDAPPGVSYATVNVLILASSVYLVLRPVQHDVSGAYDLFKYIYKLYLHEKNLSLIWNQVPASKVVTEQYISRWTELFRQVDSNSDRYQKIDEGSRNRLATFLVPYSEEIAELHARGEIFFPSNSQSYHALKKIAAFLKQ